MSQDRQQCSDDWTTLTVSKPIVLFDRKFEGFESLQDWDRDMSEALDQDYNPAMRNMPGEFDGTVHVVITYEPRIGK